MALRDYLADRRAQIEAQIKALRAELAEIKVAEQAIGGSTVTEATSSRITTSRGIKQGTIKDWVLKVLADEPVGFTTEAIMKAIYNTGGPDVPRNSMTPQLSRLKSDGFIELDGRNWRLCKTHGENQTPSYEDLLGEVPP